jgi:hypothetical protein
MLPPKPPGLEPHLLLIPAIDSDVIKEINHVCRM